jgi:hypothetical protein
LDGTIDAQAQVNGDVKNLDPFYLDKISISIQVIFSNILISYKISDFTI